MLYLCGVFKNEGKRFMFVFVVKSVTWFRIKIFFSCKLKYCYFSVSWDLKIGFWNSLDEYVGSAFPINL